MSLHCSGASATRILQPRGNELVPEQQQHVLTHARAFACALARCRVGADLVYVATAAEAALPIKCYGPELMVMPVYSITAFDAAADDAQRQQLVDESLAQVPCCIQHWLLV